MIREILKSKNVEFIFKIISGLLFIGIVYQYLELSTLGYLGFFSWGQVINDTIVTIFPISIASFSGYRAYVTNYIWFEKLNKYLRKTIGTGAIILLLGCFIYFSNNIQILGSIASQIIFMYLLGILLGFIIKTVKKNQTFYDLLIHDNVWFITFIIGLLLIMYTIINNFMYSNLYFTNMGKEYKIQYMNDRYIFTKENVFPKLDNYIFYKKINSIK